MEFLLNEAAVCIEFILPDQRKVFRKIGSIEITQSPRSKTRSARATFT